MVKPLRVMVKGVVAAMPRKRHGSEVLLPAQLTGISCLGNNCLGVGMGGGGGIAKAHDQL
jgi:hypothetical protein